MDSDLPSDSETKYELEKMTIAFTKSSIGFVLERPCGDYENPDFYVEFTCEGKYMYGKRVIFTFDILNSLPKINPVRGYMYRTSQ